MSEPQRDVQQIAEEIGAVLRVGNLLYTLMHDSWRGRVEQFRNRLMVRVERDKSVSDEEYEATVLRLHVALRGWRPIETAPNPTVDTPHDSEEWKSFLVWCPANRCEYLVVRRSGVYSIMGGVLLWEVPTLWMPRPAAPDAQKAGA